MTALEAFRIGISVALCLLGALLILTNYIIVLGLYFKYKHGSLILLFGGGFAALGLVLAPWPGISHLWYLPPIIDPGFYLALIGIAMALRDWVRSRRGRS